MKYGSLLVDTHVRGAFEWNEVSGLERTRSSVTLAIGRSSIIASLRNDLKGIIHHPSKVLAPSTCPAPELGVASGVSGRSRRRSETVGVTAHGAASALSSKETTMAPVGNVGHAGATSGTAVSGSIGAPGTGTTTLAPC